MEKYLPISVVPEGTLQAILWFVLVLAIIVWKAIAYFKCIRLAEKDSIEEIKIGVLGKTTITKRKPQEEKVLPSKKKIKKK